MRIYISVLICIILSLLMFDTVHGAERVVVCEATSEIDWPSCGTASGTLAQIAIDYPGRVAAVNMYIGALDTFYLEEAYQRMLHYPPPFAGMYLPPWLWYDGNPHGGMDHTQWESMIVARMSQPSPVTIDIWGDYTPTDGSGTIYAQFRNDSTATLNGRVIFVITEDSIYYYTDYIEWHNHVPKDYLPDHNGELVSIPVGDSVTLSQPFTIQPEWVDGNCRILAWIQDTIMQADSTIEIWQGAMIDVDELGVGELSSPMISRGSVYVSPNPCVSKATFTFAIPVGANYSIDIYDVLGRHLNTIRGISCKDQETVTWDCRSQNGSRVGTGVYFYNLVSDDFTNHGKLIIQ